MTGGQTLRERTGRIIALHGVVLKKKYGQNFLIDEKVLRNIIEASGITREDSVLEIGPGIGTLTAALSDAAGSVTSVEIDRSLIPVLEDTLSDRDNVEIVCADILKYDIEGVAHGKNGGRPLKVVANLPYYITTPIMMKLLESSLPIESMTFMVQKEVAERLVASPGSKAYGALTLSAAYHANVSVAAIVPKSAFLPSPEVDSAVVTLKDCRSPKIRVRDEALLFRLIRASFQQRRKTLYNGLKGMPGLSCSVEELREKIEKLGKGAMVRGEELSLSEFAALADSLLT
ncbi:MAG: 16S rRNA (adenine(1518)-N(6)/adenine(1519)-N(6))-dimethyltransferase RsmA [Lachnospiraceae bacterium]|nr:16S rRNA (adenine(1518)-N(6)/adenine(1519)-N(6))-dimethyltransferase RsmA [Lachnospiraceae bacterium]